MNAVLEQPITLIGDEPPARPLVTAPVSRDDVLMTAMQRGFSPEQIGQMMDLRDRQDRFDAEKAFRRDFAAFRGENIVVPLTKSVDRGRAGSFVQAEYHVAANLLSEALSRHGFSFRHDQKFGSRKWTTEGVEGDIAWVWVTCFLEHRDGHAETLTLEGPPGDLSANTLVQNMQATGSYLKRQSLLAITGTATGGEENEAGLRKREDEAEAAAAQLRDDWIERLNAAINLSVLTRTWEMAIAEIEPLNRMDVYAAVRAAMAAKKKAFES